VHSEFESIPLSFCYLRSKFDTYYIFCLAASKFAFALQPQKAALREVSLEEDKEEGERFFIAFFHVSSRS